MLSALVHKTSKAKSKSCELISLAEEIFKMSSIDYILWLLIITLILIYNENVQAV